MKKSTLLSLIGVFLVVVLLYLSVLVTRGLQRGAEAATHSCIVSICREFQDSETLNLREPMFGTDPKILEDPMRSAFIDELRSNPKASLDCNNRTIQTPLKDPWDSQILYTIKRESEFSDVFLLEVRSAGRDRIMYSSDDIFCEATRLPASDRKPRSLGRSLGTPMK